MKFSSMRVSRVEDFINATTLHSLSRSAIIIVDSACAMKLLRLIASHAMTILFLIDVRSVMRVPLILIYDLHRNFVRLSSKSSL